MKNPNEMQNVVIIGASGHGSVILDSIERCGQFKVIGFLDSYKRRGTMHNGYQVLGSELDLPRLMDKFHLHGGVVAIGDNWIRKCMVEKIEKLVPFFNFIKVVHPSAVIGKDVRIGKGTVILPGVVINANSFVGDFCIINTNSSLGHDGSMENYSSLASGVCTGGNFNLGEFSAISLGVSVIENISIGEHTVIGAGSLVLKDIGSHVVAFGLPARIMRSRYVGESYLAGGKRYKSIKVLKGEM